jgi:hypothetical protein
VVAGLTVELSETAFDDAGIGADHVNSLTCGNARCEATSTRSERRAHVEPAFKCLAFALHVGAITPALGAPRLPRVTAHR